MRTLVLSDTHCGHPRARLIDHAFIRERLIDNLRWCDRVVLNGDTFSFYLASVEQAVAKARPLLELISEHAEQVEVIAGNHDYHLAVARDDYRRLRSAAGAPPGEDPVHALLQQMMPSAQVRFHYPSFTDEAGVSYIHGHQLMALLQETGVLWIDRRRRQRLLQTGPGAGLSPDDYEQRLAPLNEALFQEAQLAVRTASAPRLRRVAYGLLRAPGIHDRLGLRLACEQAFAALPGMRADLKPTAMILMLLARVAEDFNLPPGPVCFAHTHQPLCGQRAAHDQRWEFHNSGAWTYEADLERKFTNAHEISAPGTVLRVEGRQVTLHGLLDDLSPQQLAALSRPE